MRVVPILFPSDLGRSDRGRYEVGGERGAPDTFLDTLEDEGVRLARPITIQVDHPEADDPEDAPLKFDALNARAMQSLAAKLAQTEFSPEVAYSGLLEWIDRSNRNRPARFTAEQ